MTSSLQPFRIMSACLSSRTMRSFRFSIAACHAGLLAVTSVLVCASTADALKPGDILVADRSTQAILVVDPVTGVQSTLTAGGLLGAPVAVAVAANGDIFVVDRDRFGSGSKIVKVDP